MKPELVKYESPVGPYWYHPDHPECQDGQVLHEDPNDTPMTDSAISCLNCQHWSISLEEARDVIRRREQYANKMMAWLNERRNAPDFTTIGMIEERLHPLCGMPNGHSTNTNGNGTEDI